MQDGSLLENRNGSNHRFFDASARSPVATTTSPNPPAYGQIYQDNFSLAIECKQAAGASPVCGTR